MISPPPTLAELTVIVVTYNSADVIGGCLNTVPAQAEVIVVDNASGDDSTTVARAARPDAVIMSSAANVGFGAACNLGRRAATRPYLAFVNPDVRLRPDTLARLLARLAREPHAIVGPALVDADGRLRPCKHRPVAWLDALGALPAAERWAPEGWNGKLALDNPVHTTGGQVAAVEGACFVLRASDLDAIGGFDEDLFLYYEEDSLAFRLARLGGRAIYEPSAVAEHLGQTSTDAVRDFANYQRFRSRAILYRKRDGDLRGRLAGAVMLAAALVSLLVGVANQRLRRHRRLDAAYARQALRGLAAGMCVALGPELMPPPARAPERESA